MIVNADSLDSAALAALDVVIVGAGAVGIVAAVELARQGRKVLLLEAGPEWIDAGSQKFFRLARNVGRKHLGLYEGRFRALGGTTNFWGGQLVRFDSIIFEPRSWIGADTAWPIRIDDVEPYYTRCEDLLQIGDDLRSDDRVFELARLPAQHKDDNLKFFLTRWLTVKNFAIRFKREMEQMPGLTVAIGATTTALHFDDAAGSVSGVRIRTAGGKTIDVTAPKVVLANGTIEIARLLKHPLADGRPAPWSANDWLGSGFSDHIEGTIAEIRPRNKPLFRNLFENLVVRKMKFQPRLRSTIAAQKAEEVLNFALHVQFESSGREHFDNAKIFFTGLLSGRLKGSITQLPGQLISAARVGAPMLWHYVVNRRILSPADSAAKLRIMVEQKQIRESRITLTDELDPAGMQVAALDWQVDGELELKTIRVAAAHAKGYFEGNGIADLVIHPEVEAPTGDWLGRYIDTFHHMGTTRMASEPENGVVDADCRVFGGGNLYVAGAAVFRSAGFANPTFTALALTLRLCDHLAKEERAR